MEGSDTSSTSDPVAIVVSLLVEIFEVPERRDAIEKRVHRVLEHFPEVETVPERRAILDAWGTRLPPRRNHVRGWDHALNELRQCLREGRSTGKRAYGARIVEWAAKNAGSYVGLLGIVAAAFLSISYGHFYEPLGIEPEEAGFGTTTLLLGSLPGTLVLVFVVAAYLTCVLLPLFAFSTAARERALGQSSSQQRWHVSVLALLIAFDLLVGGFACWRINFGRATLPGTISPTYVLFVSVLTAGGITGLFGSLLSQLLSMRWAVRRKAHPLIAFRYSDLRIVSIVALPCAMALVLLWLPVIAADRADAVRHGKAVRSVHLLGLPLLGVSARKVTLLGANGKANPARCLLYLGTANGDIVVFRPATDPARGQTLRLPDNQEVVTDLTGAGCDTPDNG